jgi:prolyl 4-hydroxylase
VPLFVQGFRKVAAPDDIWVLVSEFWKRNRERWTEEVWPEGNTYTNHWASPTYMVPINDSSLRGGGTKFKRDVFAAARASLEEWTGEDLVDHSIYGIRVYTDGAILASHVDRLPQVMSVILNVAQDVDEPWPIELIGHDGRAHNVTLEPGEFLLYESHSIIHGRPFPLKGRYYANLFIHLEPRGHSARYHDHAGADPTTQQYGDANGGGTGGHETTFVPGELPPYILPDSPAAVQWQREHDPLMDSNNGTPLHDFAAEGRTQELMDYLEGKKHLVNAKDKLGWTVSTLWRNDDALYRHMRPAMMVTSCIIHSISLVIAVPLDRTTKRPKAPP